MIYLDHQATTAADPRVIDAMMPWWRERAANAHSTHIKGQAARDAIEGARADVAALIGAEPGEIIFTSGATEASNLALRGSLGRGRHAITTTIEHSCVRETLRMLSKQGVSVTEVGVSGDGVVDPSAIESSISSNTRIVSVMAVNNEVGTVQALADIGASCRSHDVAFHTDAAQAAGKTPLDVKGMKIDLLSISAHKLYGPQGIGALYCRQSLRSGLTPILTGGGQERGTRSGTLPTALCVGFGAACRIAAAEMASESARLMDLRERFLARLLGSVDGIQVNGSLTERIAGNLNLAFDGIDAESLLYRLPDLALSTGSACSSAAIAPSHVLLAMGLSQEAAQSSVRIGFGRETQAAEVDSAVVMISEAVKALRLAGGSLKVDGETKTRKQGRR
ncbi:cysteine desulfurase family protein [Bradyrhizobium sp. USDA 223]|uniref:cysteine desulfurase family protein n=1 Tax=Bradyrhizobium sp. USDA 223 TaxID=3156306 RepID=UPI00383799C6